MCAPDEWGELVPSKIFNPLFPTLKVGHLVAFTYFYHVVLPYQCVVAMACGFVLGESVNT